MKFSQIAKTGLGTCAVLLFASPKAQAYPTFIAYGYGSCLSCHFNPMGNGPLNDYGRAVSATTISGRPPFAKGISEDDLAEMSGVLGRKKLPEWVRVSGDYRWLALASQVDKKATWQGIPMQADLATTLKFREDTLIASGTIGYQDTHGNPALESVLSREHYVGARIGEKWGAYAGLMDIAYGVRVPDHESFSRRATSLAQNDQAHGLLAHYTTETFEAGVNPFVGNLYQDEKLRQKGFSATAEYEVATAHRIGASILHSANDFRSRSLLGVHDRMQIREGTGFVAEAGLIRTKTPAPLERTGPYLLGQLLSRVARGFHLLGTVETYANKWSDADARYYRATPGFQWFPMQRLEFRFDVMNQWAIQRGVPGSDYSLSLLAQIHLSL